MSKKAIQRPSVEQLERALEQEQYKKSYRRVLKSTFYALITVAAAAALVVMLWLPVMQIYGTSMEPTLCEGQIVVSVKGSRFDRGDIVAFYYGNKLLVKRFIAGPGEWVNIDSSGNVFVNGEYLEEDYIAAKALGECNIELPYQVPEGKCFLIGDHRATSLDSRNTAVGCVDAEQVVGRIVFCVWPFDSFGIMGDFDLGAQISGGIRQIFNS